MRQGVRGDDVEAKSQRVRFDACGSPDFDHDPGHRMHAFLASAPDNEVDNALAQCQLVHRRSSTSKPSWRKPDDMDADWPPGSHRLGWRAKSTPYPTLERIDQRHACS